MCAELNDDVMRLNFRGIGIYLDCFNKVYGYPYAYSNCKNVAMQKLAYYLCEHDADLYNYSFHWGRRGPYSPVLLDDLVAYDNASKKNPKFELAKDNIKWATRDRIKRAKLESESLKKIVDNIVEKSKTLKNSCIMNKDILNSFDKNDDTDDRIGAAELYSSIYSIAFHIYSPTIVKYEPDKIISELKKRKPYFDNSELNTYVFDCIKHMYLIT